MLNFHKMSLILLLRSFFGLRTELEMDESRSNSHLEDHVEDAQWPVTTVGDNSGCRGMHVKLDKPEPAPSRKNYWLVCRLAGTKLREILMGLMKKGPPDEGASRESRHRADSEKSAKLMLGRVCLVEGMYPSIVYTRWGLRPLNAKSSFLAITCTFNSKYRWQERQTSFPYYFHQSSPVIHKFFDQFGAIIFL